MHREMKVNPVLAGLLAATTTVALFWAWSAFEHRYLWGSAYTDLPGQDSLRLVTNLEWPVGVIVILLAGRLVGVISAGRKWVGVLLGIAPVNILILVSAEQHALEVWPFYLGTCVLGLAVAYLPSWLVIGGTRGRRTRA
jgi:hypothetical protein